MYELEFHRVGTGDCSGDAITLRYWDGAQWRVGVIDGGYAETGHALCAHIWKHYETDHLDFVVSSHPDNDHMSGLRVVLEEMGTVGELWMHVPFVHAGAIVHLFQSRRWQVPNLETELRRAYPYVQELLELAAAKGTRVRLPFQGETIGPFCVLSPSVDLYQTLMPQFRDTPAPDQSLLGQMGRWLSIGRRYSLQTLWSVFEDWSRETLREGGTTSAENESSVVLLGGFGTERVLLTADAGLVALDEAKRYSLAANLQLARPNVFQVPHHGSRNNISPSLLNFLIGPPLPPGVRAPVNSVVSCGAEDTTHPRQVVVNALQRRGSPPQCTRNGTLRFAGNGMPARADWATAPALPFHQTVEAYD